MTAMPSFEAFDRSDMKVGRAPSSRNSVCVDETYWGYIIKPTTRTPSRVLIGQGAAWFMAMVFAIAALGLWIMPGAAFGGDVLTMKLIASIVLAGLSLMLLNFANRGTQVEIQVDTSLGEVREVVRNRAGRSNLIGRYGFDAIGAVYLDRGVSQSRLLMAYRNSPETIEVVTGATHELDMLRNRLGRDLIITNEVRPDHHPKAVPTFASAG